ncbi:MAG TPA: hypothetical protein VHI77_03235 [Solirubrobacterales bacterium]|jgi:hypothetical protein|nr:hypothetical protein [Solirubrobacterales bacterium]
MRVRALPAIALLIAVLALAGCGGSSDAGETTGAAQPTAPKRYLAKGDAICRQMLRETRRVGRRFIKQAVEAEETSLFGAETERIVKPGIVVLERIARRFRALSAEAHDQSLAIYVGLYEPLIQLGELRLAAGEAGDLNEAKNLEAQMEEVGSEQRLAARLAGLHACEIDFLHALVSSWRSQ